MTPIQIAAFIGAITPISIFVFGLVLKMGQMMQKIESLEEWRGNIRKDFWEVSEKIERLIVGQAELFRIVDERTDRRSVPRH